MNGDFGLWRKGLPLPGNLFANLLILAGSTLLFVVAVRLPVSSVGRPGAVGHLTAGFLAAAAVLAAFILIRRFFDIRPADMVQRIAWLGAVVATEEGAKLGITARLRAFRTAHGTRPSGSDQAKKDGSRLSAAALRGWGFAAAEHLLYIAVLPGSFAVRMVTAGAMHVGTSVWYALPQRRHRSTATVNMARYLAAVGIHMLYNLTLTTLDSIGPIW